MSSSPSRLSRRTVFTGAGAVGAIAAVASLLPSGRPEVDVPGQTARPAPARGGGYSLSDHVKQYYKTTRI